MSNESKISIKVIVDKQKNKVMYAEADHTFVDVLFSFMTLPLGAIARLLNLPDRFFFNEECKYSILNPRSPASHHCRKLKVNIDDTEPKKYFVCQSSGCARYSNCSKATCPKCGKTMNREISIEDDDDDNRVGGGVFVSDVSTFIVTDDLCVLPYTPGCCIQLLRDFGVTDAGDIEEITVDLGYQQILDLLRVSFSCNSPLTYVVLNPSRDLFIFQHGTFDLCTSTDETKHEILLQVSTKKSTGKFLFAEAEEDFVDFVSGFLAISLGTVIGKFMKGKSCLVCMDNIYKSISDLSEERYFRSKDVLLYNHVGRYLTRNLMFPLSRNNFPLVEISQTTTPTEQVYRKVYGNLPMIFFRSPALCLNDPRVNGELLKRSGMFMLTDDLVITPSSSISTMNVLNKCNVPLNDIERHKVKIGLKEGIRMVYASMISSSTLSKGLEHQLEILKQST